MAGQIGAICGQVSRTKKEINNSDTLAKVSTVDRRLFVIGRTVDIYLRFIIYENTRISLNYWISRNSMTVITRLVILIFLLILI